MGTLSINSTTGEIDVSASDPGEYQITRTVTNSNYSNNPSTATDIVTINPADNAAFSYSGSPFDINNASNPTPTVTGLSGGTFSSISGFNFDGVYDSIQINPAINLGTTNTISLWYNGQANTYSTVLGNDDAPNDYAVFIANGTTVAYKVQDASNGSVEWSVTNVNDGNWHHLVFFRTNTTINFYLDGNLQTVNSNTLANNDTKIDTIGAKTNGSMPFKGKMSNLALWNTDQSANIANIYNNGVPQSSYTSTPSAWYKMSNDATYNSSTSTWSIPNAANPGTLDASSTTLPSNSLDYLDISSSTGLISLSTSNVGTYSVSYNTTGATGSICPATDTQSVQLVNTNFDYPSNLCNASGSSPILPTNFVQQAGGQFTISPTSGSPGIDSASGLLSPAGSTAGTYAITYTIGSNSTTKNVTSGAVLAPSTTTNTSTLSFNGTDSYIQVASSSDFAFGTSGYSISLWFKPNGTNSGLSNAGVNILDMRSTSINEPVPSLWIRTDGATGFIKLLVELNYRAQATVTLNSGNWYHVVVTNDGYTSKIYLNGNTTPIASGTDTTNYLAAPLKIGRFYANNQYSFSGEIDEVAIWNKAITSCDVAGIYQASSNGITADLSTVYPSNLKYYNRMGD